MKEGYINASFLKVIFTGAGGVGKTHAVCLLRGVPPPSYRESTDCVNKAVTLRVDASDDKKWEEIDVQKRMQIIAEGICAAKRDAEIIEQQPISTSSSPQNLPELITTFQQEVQQQPQTQPDQDLESQQTAQLHLISHIDPKPSIVLPSQPLETEFDLIKHIHEAVMSGEISGEIMGTKWVYAVDTGGQPPFHELLSAFIKGASVCAFVFKLSESLSHRPLVEYWVDGTNVGEPFEHPLSNRQILEQSIQTIQALPGLSNEYSESEYSVSPLLLVIGTHRDKQGECTETLKDKEKALHDILKTAECNFLYNQHDGVKQVVFDVNAKNPEQKDKDIASTLRSVIANRMPEPTKIPLRHYGLELELEHLATTKQVISMEECRAIGNRLNFDEEGLKAALRFLHRLNVLLYYPKVKEVERLVFCDPLILIKIVSKVVAHIRKGATKEWKESYERGLITIKQLNTGEFRNSFRSDISFTPKSLFKLFEHLLIVAVVRDQQFFMPCLLDETTDISRPNSDHCSPLTFQFRNKEGKPVYAPSGLFCALVAFLLSLKDRDSELCSWEFAESDDSDILYRNIIRFQSRSPPAYITLINYRTSFEVFVKCQPQFFHEHLPKIRSIILKGLEEVKKVRNFKHVDYNEAFMCKCSQATLHGHLAEIDIGAKMLICPYDFMKGGLLEMKELVWYGESPASKPSNAYSLVFIECPIW